MNERNRSYLVPLLIIFAQSTISFVYWWNGLIPDSAQIPEYPSGLSTKSIPLWTVLFNGPVLSIFVIFTMALDIKVTPKLTWWRVEEWRLRGVPGPGLDAFLLAVLISHALALANVSSHWTLDQGLIQTIAGFVLGSLLIWMGNLQTKISSVGLWTITPWRLENPHSRQKCQRIASRISIAGGFSIILLNILLIGSKPIAYIGMGPIFPQLSLTFLLFFAAYLVTAALTWKPAREPLP